jgi:hypothetical protein
MRGARRPPQAAAMALDDRSADRKSHPAAFGFCREEGFEGALRDGLVCGLEVAGLKPMPSRELRDWVHTKVWVPTTNAQPTFTNVGYLIAAHATMFVIKVDSTSQDNRSVAVAN